MNERRSDIACNIDLAKNLGEKEMEKTKPQRRYDLDWMRVLLILSVFLYHSGRVFHKWDWHVKDVISPGFASVLGFMEMWMLPAIFVVSAASIWYSLGYQKAGRFI